MSETSNQEKITALWEAISQMLDDSARILIEQKKRLNTSKVRDFEKYSDAMLQMAIAIFGDTCQILALEAKGNVMMERESITGEYAR